MFVLDASMSLAWGIEDATDLLAWAILRRLRESEAVVPPIWPLEVANALLIGERRQRLSRAEVSRFLDVLAGLPISIDPVDGLHLAFGSVSALAREQGLSAYDACYLDLALRRGLPLATLDSRLQTAATRLAVPLVGPG